jgi:hypothetical protein
MRFMVHESQDSKLGWTNYKLLKFNHKTWMEVNLEIISVILANEKLVETSR